MKNPKMLRLVYDLLKTRKMYTNAGKTLLFVIRYVPDHYKPQGSSNEVLLKMPLILILL